MNTKKFFLILRVEAAFLFIQFLLGMLINIYGVYPFSNATLWAAATPYLLFTHIALGTVILIISAVLYLGSKKLNDRLAKMLLLSALIFVLFTFLSGVAFILGGGEYFSIFMSIGFGIAFAQYVFLIGRMSRW